MHQDHFNLLAPLHALLNEKNDMRIAERVFLSTDSIIDIVRPRAKNDLGTKKPFFV
jgi:hypothetical protein